MYFKFKTVSFISKANGTKIILIFVSLQNTSEINIMHPSSRPKQYSLESSLKYMENVVFELIILSICHYKHIFLIACVG